MTLMTFRLIFLAGVFSLGAAPLFAQLAKRWGVVDVPGSAPHKQHKKTIPLAGGWSLAITVVSIVWLTGNLHNLEIRAILLSSAIVFAFGVWDDARGLGAPAKLTGQLAAALLLITMDVYVRLFYAQWLNWTLTILWVVGITNAYNFVDSMDGLATGLAGLAAAFFMVVTFDAGQIELSLLSAILLGACIGSYFFNITPAHIFLGDAGSQWLGFTLAALAITYNPVGFLRTQSWFVPILLVGVPIFDTNLVVFSRLRRGLPIYKANSDHTYHRLVAFGVHPSRAVLTMHLAALLLGCLAFITLSMAPLFANIVYAACIILGTIAIIFMDSKKRWP